MRGNVLVEEPGVGNPSAPAAGRRLWGGDAPVYPTTMRKTSTASAWTIQPDAIGFIQLATTS